MKSYLHVYFTNSFILQYILNQKNFTNIILLGQLLCGGLFSSDSLSNWFSAVALSYALIDDNTQKEQLLRVLLATNIGKPPVTLMQQCVMLLQQGNKIQCKLGLLILLCRWIAHCLTAVKSFLLIDSSIAYLTALLSSQENNDDLQETLLQSMCAILIGLCVHFNDNSISNYTKVTPKTKEIRHICNSNIISYIFVLSFRKNYVI